MRKSATHEPIAATVGLEQHSLFGIAPDAEAPEPPPDPEEDEEEPEPEPFEAEIEPPEPCPDSLGDEDRAAWLEYNREHEGEEIPESKWLDYQEGWAQGVVEAQLERYPFR